MPRFKLEDYETVKERKARFYEDHKDGRIIVKNITPTEDLLDFAIYKATIYLNKEDQANNLPKATGTAMEIRDKQKSISNRGEEYESVNYSSWTENCEESAVGRALDNAGYSGNKKCSREEIELAQRNRSSLSSSTATKKQISMITNLVNEQYIDRAFIEKVLGKKVSKFSELTIKEASNLITEGLQIKNEMQGK